MSHVTCNRCRGGFNANEQMVNSNGEIYHEDCFVCSQCFQKFPEGLFYEVCIVADQFVNSWALESFFIS